MTLALVQLQQVPENGDGVAQHADGSERALGVERAGRNEAWSERAFALAVEQRSQQLVVAVWRAWLLGSDCALDGKVWSWGWWTARYSHCMSSQVV